MLSTKRNRKAAKRFFKKALSSNHNQIPIVITVDKNPAYPPAIDELKNDKILPKNVGIRQIKYLNNIIEQDHRGSVAKIFSYTFTYFFEFFATELLFRSIKSTQIASEK